MVGGKNNLNHTWGNNRNKQTQIRGWEANRNKPVAGWKKVGNGGWGNNHYTQRELNE